MCAIKNAAPDVLLLGMDLPQRTAGINAMEKCSGFLPIARAGEPS